MMRIAALGAVTAVLAAVLRRGTPELALLLGLCAGGWMLLQTAGALSASLEVLDELSGLADVDPDLLDPVVKTVAVSILTRITAEVCRSSGETGTAAFVEQAGTVISLGLALPLVRAASRLMGEMLP